MTVLGSLRSVREWAYPQLMESAFLEKGVLTPEEFVKAGDELVFRCPTWEWATSSKASKLKSYLPPDKQYLITRNVPCRNRVASLETNLKMEGVEDGNGCGDDWMVSSILAEGEEDDDNIEDDFDILDEDGEVVTEEAKPAAVAASTEAAADDDDDEYGDMDDYEDEDILVDEDAAALPKAEEASSSIVKTRTYDLSITYDKYYQVPRVWMVGRDEDDQPLTSGQMMEDVISDYANKTVTMEVHPHVSSSCPHASIHPCQHSKVMKAIVKNLIKGTVSEEGDDKPKGPAVETYLFIFLKFVSSMIPTINYDFTMEVTADTSK
mmetsp:Transcript_10311/g.25923  ORF Transcript_10311/g.25923 Transcript_10311/m.25923 type:complete len:322 (+) Transcript_10311:1075-2040(+)|eukprot:CAMPEP_0116090764 /NCGR_PEP_ID=MMETSP0327-20121206/7143_1 /TAXON_ID=44447 /ORGANISM="Pseudo-nitzschia delicatissima, Strain B596" /LENGTH=321 /DNA_ID=CAMNT_0003582065 /DNA_START=1542 /DNA_END=2507 /DNA_ORIENTATION=+